jgi:hypothetical protein
MICFLGHDQSYYVSVFQVVVVAGLKLLPIWQKQYDDRASKLLLLLGTILPSGCSLYSTYG